jgi:FlaA1/EpsC-like NDP-sugar epimerase
MVKELGTIYSSSLWLQDTDMTAESLPELGELEGKTVLITGANGLICSAVIDVLMRYNETHGENIRVIAAGRSQERISARFGPFMDRKSFGFMHYDALSSEPVECNADFVIHGAGNAHPVAMSEDPVGTIMANIAGTNAVLQYISSNSSVWGGQKRDCSSFPAVKFTAGDQKENHSLSVRMITGMSIF